MKESLTENKYFQTSAAIGMIVLLALFEINRNFSIYSVFPLLSAFICSRLSSKIPFVIVTGIFFLLLKSNATQMVSTVFGIVIIFILYKTLLLIQRFWVKFVLLVLILNLTNYFSFIFSPELKSVISILNLAFWPISYSLLSSYGFMGSVGVFKMHFSFLLEYPFAKGYAYLKSRQAQSLKDTRRGILSGIALIIWAQFLYLLIGKLNPYFIQLNIQEVLAQPQAYNNIACWKVLIKDFSLEAMNTIALGHMFVGHLRIGGFLITKNSHLPFLSKTVTDFYNRYDHYYKEFLMEMFFFPSYFFFNKLKDQFRLIIAVVLSAGLGNFLFHTQLLTNRSSSMGKNYIISFAIYAFLLAFGICLSMMMQIYRKNKSKNNKWGAFLSPVLITLFFIFLHIFFAHSNEPVVNRFLFLKQLLTVL